MSALLPCPRCNKPDSAVWLIENDTSRVICKFCSYSGIRFRHTVSSDMPPPSELAADAWNAIPREHLPPSDPLSPIDYEEKYHVIMDLLRRSRMEHGDCKSGERYGGIPRACTACMAERKIEKELSQYKGRQVRLA